MMCHDLPEFLRKWLLNSLNYFSLGIESLWIQSIHVWLGLIDSDNVEGQRSNVLMYLDITLPNSTPR